MHRGNLAYSLLTLWTAALSWMMLTWDQFRLQPRADMYLIDIESIQWQVTFLHCSTTVEVKLEFLFFPIIKHFISTVRVRISVSEICEITLKYVFNYRRYLKNTDWNKSAYSAEHMQAQHIFHHKLHFYNVLFVKMCVFLASFFLSFRSLLFSFRVAKWPKIFSPLKSVKLEHPVSAHSATIRAFFFPVPPFPVSNLTLFVCNRKPARALFSRGSIRNYKSNKTNVYLP